jgi:segregation and condensation protein B
LVRPAVIFFGVMSNLPAVSDESESHPPTKASGNSPLSLSRLRQAFASMLGQPGANPSPRSTKTGQAEAAQAGSRLSPENIARNFRCEINPCTVAEAILFVGRPDNNPMSARELAAAMRGVSPAEIETAVDELNAVYDVDGAPYHVEKSNGGYRLALRKEFDRMRGKFYGRVKEARLSPAAVEVLSVVAYNQPVTVEQVNELRGAPSGPALSMLVRRRIVRLERPEDGNRLPVYTTTERFLKLFGLENLETLPRTEELEKV